MAFNAGLSRAIERIGKLEQTIAQLSEVPRLCAEASAPRINREIQQQFSRGTDPYGRRWAPITATTRRLRKRKGGPPLSDTRKLRTGTFVKLMRGHGLRLVLGAPYGFFHQVGTRNMPARRIFPQYGLPAKWRQILRDEARAAFRRQVRSA